MQISLPRSNAVIQCDHLKMWRSPTYQRKKGRNAGANSTKNKMKVEKREEVSRRALVAFETQSYPMKLNNFQPK